MIKTEPNPKILEMDLLYVASRFLYKCEPSSNSNNSLLKTEHNKGFFGQFDLFNKEIGKWNSILSP